jgi:prephenate dehydrogenase
VGRGLIGGSIELGLRRLGHSEVVALDRGDRLDAADGADLIILSAPIGENIRILSDLPAHVAGHALITDTGSTKVTTVAAAEGLPSRLRFVGGHPVAGAASGGLDAASADLFDGRPWIFTPTARAAAADVAQLRSVVESLGASVHVMDAEAHDRVLAFVSHLPQLAASALMRVAGDGAGEGGLAIAGSGLRDSTRLAGSPAALWRDIAASNRTHINAALDSLIETLQHLRDEPDEALPEVFQAAAEWKLLLDQSGRR